MNNPETMFSPLAAIGRHGTLVMPLGILLGLTFPTLAYLMRPVAEPVVIVMLALSIYRLDPSSIVGAIRNPWTILIALLVLLILVPMLVNSVGRLAGLPDGLLMILTAWSACPPLVSVPGLALIIGLDAAAALLLMVAATGLFALTLPAMLSILTSDEIVLDPLEMTVDLVILVGIGTLAGQGLRRFVGPTWAGQSGPAADGLLVILMLVFAITVMGGLHDAWAGARHRIPLIIMTAFIASIGLQLLAVLVFAAIPRPFAGTIALANGNRNVAILLPTMTTAAVDQMWLYLAVVQFPIYILPVISKPLYKRYCD